MRRSRNPPNKCLKARVYAGREAGLPKSLVCVNDIVNHAARNEEGSKLPQDVEQYRDTP
jgi:hypothetical protein